MSSKQKQSNRRRKKGKQRQEWKPKAPKQPPAFSVNPAPLQALRLGDENPFDMLPDEIVEMIFSLNHQRELPATALVCSRWAHLCCIHRRSFVLVRNVYHLTASVCKRLSWHCPKRLELGHRHQETSARIGDLANLSIMQSLETLIVCWCLGGRHLDAVLLSLPRLKALKLPIRSNISAKGALSLTQLSALTSLQLVQNMFGSGALSSLVPLTRLRSLDVREGLTGGHALGVSQLTSLRDLTSLNLSSYTGDDLAKGLAHLTSLHSLKVLNLAKTHIVRPDSEGIGSLVSLTWLEQLDVSWCEGLAGFPDDSIAQFTALRQLRYLKVTGLKDDGVRHLATLPALRSLHMGNCARMTSTSLLYLTSCGSLTSLSVQWCSNLTDDALAPLTTLSALVSLDIGDSQNITGRGLAHVCRLRKLRALQLGGCMKLTDRDVSRLIALRCLAWLGLSSCKRLTVAGIRSLAGLPTLHHLDLRLCPHLEDVSDIVPLFPVLDTVAHARRSLTRAPWKLKTGGP